MNIYPFRIILVNYLLLLISLTFHEWGHAWAAHKLGDNTPQQQGRLSLNPLVHIDLIGTIILPLIMMLFVTPLGIWGWAKPVEFNINNFKNKKFGDLLVILAGPASNLLLALFAAIAANTIFRNNGPISGLMGNILFLNCLLFVFNMLPIPPLDGSCLLKKVFHVTEETYLYISQWGFVTILILLQLPFVNKILLICIKMAMGFIYMLSELICWPLHALSHSISGFL
ncbi:MAG: hypothetical protein A2007_03640 [Verrucomicrobia bacterium GWC2_42_7]|nr:MAG: hypothetical protein A2007_03640 [Verrucomicrobia bacterium GWC2_42_7]